MNDKQRARLDRLTLANQKLQKSIDEKRKDLQFIKGALKDIETRARERGIRMKTHEQLQKLGVLVIPKTDREGN